MPIERIEVVQVPVANLDAATRFYEGLLGTVPAVANPSTSVGAATLFDLSGGGASLQLTLVERGTPNAAAPLGLAVASGTDLEEMLRDVAALGGSVVYRTTRPEWLFIGVHDPDGNLLELVIRA